jgi:hypothetical protein
MLFGQFYFARNSVEEGRLQRGADTLNFSEQFLGKPEKMESSLASPSCRSLGYFIFHRDSYAYSILHRSRSFTGRGGERGERIERERERERELVFMKQ